MRRSPNKQDALIGINAAVVGISQAALYNPPRMTAILAPVDFVLATFLFLMLVFWNCHTWMIVMAGTIGGTLIILSPEYKIFEDYRPEEFKEQYISAFQSIKSRIHVSVAAEIERNLQTDLFGEDAALLLEHYYDPKYDYSPINMRKSKE